MRQTPSGGTYFAEYVRQLYSGCTAVLTINKMNKKYACMTSVVFALYVTCILHFCLIFGYHIKNNEVLKLLLG